MKDYKVYSEILIDDVSIKDIDRFKSVVPESILNRCLKFKSIHEQYLKLKGWEYILKKGIHESEISFGEKGKPYLKNSQFHFNISNSKKVVVVAIGEFELGVDVEIIKKPRTNIFSRVFTANEIQYINTSKDASVAFTSLWTRKEAVVKLFGGGISMGMTKFEVLENNLVAFDRKITLEELEIGEGYISHIAYYNK